MCPLMLDGARPGIGTIILLTGVRGSRITGTRTMDIIITGIIIMVRTTAGGTVTGYLDGATVITEEDTEQGHHTFRTGISAVITDKLILDPIWPRRVLLCSERIIQKRLLLIINFLRLIKQEDLL